MHRYFFISIILYSYYKKISDPSIIDQIQLVLYGYSRQYFILNFMCKYFFRSIESKGCDQLKTFLKLNITSSLLALLFFIFVELVRNTYRLNDLTHIGFKTLDYIFLCVLIAILIIIPLLLKLIIRQKLTVRRMTYFLAVLWIPYFFLFNLIFYFFFPLGGGNSNPINNFVINGAFILYPVYLLSIISLLNEKNPAV